MYRKVFRGWFRCTVQYCNSKQTHIVCLRGGEIRNEAVIFRVFIKKLNVSIVFSVIFPPFPPVHCVNASKPSNQSKGLGGNIGCRDKLIVGHQNKSRLVIQYFWIKSSRLRHSSIMFLSTSSP